MLTSEIGAGDMVSTKHSKMERWITNAVFSFNENEHIIELTLKPELLDILMGKDDIIEFRIVKEEYIYFINGIVEEIIIDNPDRLRVRIENINKVKNNRTEIRYDVWLNSVISGQDIDAIETSLVINISKSGMAVLSDQNFTIGSEIFIDVHLGYGKVVRFKGKPVRKMANGYRIEYGILSIPIDGLNARLLNEYLHEVEERNNRGISIIKKIREKTKTAE